MSLLALNVAMSWVVHELRMHDESANAPPGSSTAVAFTSALNLLCPEQTEQWR